MAFKRSVLGAVQRIIVAQRVKGFASGEICLFASGDAALLAPLRSALYIPADFCEALVVLLAVVLQIVPLYEQAAAAF